MQIAPGPSLRPLRGAAGPHLWWLYPAVPSAKSVVRKNLRASAQQTAKVSARRVYSLLLRAPALTRTSQSELALPPILSILYIPSKKSPFQLPSAPPRLCGKKLTFHSLRHR